MYFHHLSTFVFLMLMLGFSNSTSAQTPKAITPFENDIEQTPKEEVLQLINNWYKAHPDNYALNIEGEEAIATFENYHQDNPTKDLLRIRWKGMTITMSFKTDLKKLDLSIPNLKKEFSYLSLEKIHNDIDLKGWEIYPCTPMSSTSEGIKFIKIENGELYLSIDWQMYTIFGYSQTQSCKWRMQRTDTATPEDCYVGVRQYLPLSFTIKVKLPA